MLIFLIIPCSVKIWHIIKNSDAGWLCFVPKHPQHLMQQCTDSSSLSVNNSVTADCSIQICYQNRHKIIIQLDAAVVFISTKTVCFLWLPIIIWKVSLMTGHTAILPWLTESTFSWYLEFVHWVVAWRLLDSQTRPVYLAEISERSMRSWRIEVQGLGQPIQTLRLKINHALQKHEGTPHLLAVCQRKKKCRAE